MTSVTCDGCLQPASPEHIALRLRRLELATRFRPIHISVLFLAPWPPSRAGDDFYHLGDESAEHAAPRSGSPGNLFENLMVAAGTPRAAGKGKETCLAEFQKRGFYMADCVECPVEEPLPGAAVEPAAWLAQCFGPTVVKRIHFSYKPRHIALLGTTTRELIRVLKQAGYGDHLLLQHEQPVGLPQRGDVAGWEAFRAALGEALAAASSRAQGA